MRVSLPTYCLSSASRLAAPAFPSIDLAFGIFQIRACAALRDNIPATDCVSPMSVRFFSIPLFYFYLIIRPLHSPSFSKKSLSIFINGVQSSNLGIR